MKIKFLCLLLCMSHWAVAQDAKRLTVAKTHCSMIPPEGFTIDTILSGITSKEASSSIVIAEMDIPVDSLASELMAKDSLNQDGMLRKFEVLHWKYPNAVLCTAIQTQKDLNYTTIILFFGDAEKSVSITAHFPKNDKELATAIKEAMLSTEYRDPVAKTHTR